MIYFLLSALTWLLLRWFPYHFMMGEPNIVLEPSKAKKMKKLTVNNSHKDVKRLVKPIPNIRTMSISLSPWDKIFMKYGIYKRETPAKLRFTKYKNSRLNRYVYYQMSRLSRMHGSAYWKIAYFLIRKSRSFYLITLNHVFPLWYREIPFHKIVGMRQRLTKLANPGTLRNLSMNSIKKLKLERHTLDGAFKYTTTMIPKANGKLRQLSVPTPVWRLYLHLTYIFLYWYVCHHHDNYIPAQQHGFIPSRGTGTAWQYILTHVIKSPNIYEFDLESFFPNVSCHALRHLLSTWDIPVEVIYDITMINQVEESLDDSNNVIFHRNYRKKGVHQGSALSPLLASFSLVDTLFKQKNETIMYADDGLLFGPHAEGVETHDAFFDYNIMENATKSGWVKKNNQWLKPLKFLGLEYDGQTNILRGHTRKGSHLEMNQWDLIHSKLGDLAPVSHYHKPRHHEESWSSLFQSQLWGFIQNRLYVGDWNLKNIEQDFSLKYVEKSYVSRSPHPLTIFNASSYAANYLAEVLKRKRL